MALLRKFRFLCLTKNSLYCASYGNPYINKCLKNMYIYIFIHSLVILAK